MLIIQNGLPAGKDEADAFIINNMEHIPIGDSVKLDVPHGRIAVPGNTDKSVCYAVVCFKEAYKC